MGGLSQSRKGSAKGSRAWRKKLPQTLWGHGKATVKFIPTTSKQKDSPLT